MQLENSKSKQRNSLTIVFFFLGLTTLVFYSTFADPFNVAKFIVLLIGSGFLIGPLILERKNIDDVKRLFFILLVFLMAGFISLITTDVKMVGLLGESLRRNGFTTYFCLSIFCLYTAQFYSINNRQKFVRATLLISVGVISYGLLQQAGFDFIKWTGSAGIISSYGNSNFAGAGIAIFTVLSFGFIFSTTSLLRWIALFVFMFGSLAVYFSNARQAQLILLFFIALFMIQKILILNRNLGYVLSFIGILITAVVLLGIFKVGPLSSYLYKETIAIRIYYWKAAIKMFISHPIFGVGLDRYGAYFKEYRNSQYSLNYGFDITSSAAHNVILQLFATGGLLFGLSYLLFTIYIFNCGIKSVKNKQGIERDFNFTIFAGWLAFQAQSLVSVEYIPIALLGWILAGILVRNSIEKSSVVKKVSSISKELNRILVTALICLVTFPISFFLFKVENNMYLTRISFAPEVQDSQKAFNLFSDKTLKSPLLDPSYKVAIGSYLIDYKQYDKGISIVKDSIRKDPRDLQALAVMAIYGEITTDYQSAIGYRKKIEVLDPWNAKNQLKLVRLFYAVGDSNSAQVYYQKIMDFAANTDVGKQAQDEFPSLK